LDSLAPAETTGEDSRRDGTFDAVLFSSGNNIAIDLEAITQAYREALAFYRTRKDVLAAVLEAAGYDAAVRAAGKRSARVSYAARRTCCVPSRRPAGPRPTWTRKPPPRSSTGAVSG
jgi:hypothetical protein